MLEKENHPFKEPGPEPDKFSICDLCRVYDKCRIAYYKRTPPCGESLNLIRKIAAIPEDAVFESTIRILKQEAQDIVDKLPNG